MLTNINKDYAEVDQRELDEVNDAADIAEGLDIAERVEIFQKKPAFVNFKDTKTSFSTAAAPAEVPVRLITPSKSQLGKVSKIKLLKLNDQVRASPSQTSGARQGTLRSGLRAFRSRVGESSTTFSNLISSPFMGL